MTVECCWRSCCWWRQEPVQDKAVESFRPYQTLPLNRDQQSPPSIQPKSKELKASSSGSSQSLVPPELVLDLPDWDNGDPIRLSPERVRNLLDDQEVRRLKKNPDFQVTWFFIHPRKEKRE